MQLIKFTLIYIPGARDKPLSLNHLDLVIYVELQIGSVRLGSGPYKPYRHGPLMTGPDGTHTVKKGGSGVGSVVIDC